MNFREARKVVGFHVAPPPVAVTICSDGEDIRAFLGTTPKRKDVWYAQYRQVSAKGVLWRIVTDANRQPMCYLGATEALKAAKLARDSNAPARAHRELR